MLTVEHAASRGYRDYYRVSAGAKGGEMVTVRVGREGVYACLTCLRIDCRHAEAAEDFARAQSAPGTASAAA